MKLTLVTDQPTIYPECGEPNECFRNVLLAVKEGPRRTPVLGLLYGLDWCGWGIYKHAWYVESDGTVADPTARRGWFHDWRYYGYAMPRVEWSRRSNLWTMRWKFFVLRPGETRCLLELGKDLKPVCQECSEFI